jgi:hypothetical protein
MRSHCGYCPWRILRAGLTFVLGLLWTTRGIAADAALDFKLAPYNDVIIVSANMNGAAHLCVIDSGCTTNVLDVRLRTELGDPLGTATFSAANGEDVQAELFKCPAITLVRFELPRNEVVACHDMTSLREAVGQNIDGIIGMPIFWSTIIQMDFDHRQLTRNIEVMEGGVESRCGLRYLRRFRVTFDLARNQIYLNKGDSFNAEEILPIGVILLRRNGQTIVAYVTKNSEFDKAGIRENDSIVSINGTPVGDEPIGKLVSDIRERRAAAGSVDLQIRRNGKQRLYVVAR